MLIIAPSSETKREPPSEGAPVDIEDLSFPALTPTRKRVLEALMATSARLDAFERLNVRPTMAREVARNTRLLEVPAVPAADVYTGPLHDGLDAAGLSDVAAARLDESLVIVSALWGAVRPADRIPPYRMRLYSNLVGIERLDHLWRSVLPNVLAEAAGVDGVVVDLRSPPFQATGLPTGLVHRTITLRIDLGPPGHRVGDVIAKRVRGEAGRHLLETQAEPADPDAVADVLAERWPVRLEAPDRAGRTWSLTLSVET